METIRVNMTPCEDVQTIHASQNDGEAREWGFKLHNNGDVIDSSEVTDQMVFKAYKGGTEQLLPENTSTPVTSPFNGDIRYPQGLLADQEFTYRQSPTESDGLAKITDIKGNTLNWNQLVQNGNFADSSGWTSGGGDFNITVGNNIATLEVVTPRNSAILQGNVLGTKQDHFYYATADLKYDVAPGSSDANKIFIGSGGYDGILKNVTQSNTWVTVSGFFKRNTGGSDAFRLYPRTGGMSAGDKIYVRNVMIVELTAIFGADKSLQLWQMEQRTEGSGVAYFRSLFPLSYYSYNQGSLLSFMGNGIKTVGANQWHNPHTGQTINDVTGEVRTSANTDWMADKILIGTDKKLYLYLKDIGRYTRGSVNIAMYGANGYLGRINALQSNPQVPQKKVITLNQNTIYVIPFGYMSGGATSITDVKITLANIDINEYIPYTSSTLSLPISTYFPNGMDGVGTAYDELANSGYVKRMERVDLGSITYTRMESQTSGVYFFIGPFNSIPNIKVKSNYDVWNIKTAMYETVSSANIYLGTAQNKTIGGHDGKTVRIRDDSFTNATDLKNSLSGQYLVYELATPTETSFTTASLVTENAEIPLSNEDGTLIGKCTEELSTEPGFHDAKIKLSDSDGECYSNKIQLHVERSPQ